MTCFVESSRDYYGLLFCFIEIAVFDGSKASTAMCCRRTGGSAPAAQPVQAVAMTSATRKSRRGGDGAHELFRPLNADAIVSHLIRGAQW